MRYSFGNNKLGKENVIVTSRPVGDTCPDTCEYLQSDECYAHKTEVRFTSARRASFVNLVTERNKIRAMLITADAEGKDVRFHERGEFLKDGVLDTEYVENIEWACQSVIDSDDFNLPAIWFFTHVYDERLSALSRFGISCYASVHTDADYQAAKSAGFTLFAWNDNRAEYTDAKPRSKVKQEVWRDTLPRLVVINNEKYVTCPEMVHTYHKVTCTKTKNTRACRLCVDGKANVIFPKH